MSNQEVISENICVKTKQLIGSSKRKRKSSVIKHNVILNDKSNVNEVPSPIKPVRTYFKKVKSDKGNGEKDKIQNEEPESLDITVLIKKEKEDEKVIGNITAAVETTVDNKETVDEESETMPITVSEESSTAKSKGKGILALETETQDPLCLGKQQQCQNCKFCSKHKPPVSENNSKKENAPKTYPCKVCAGLGLKRVYNSLEKFKRHSKEVHEPKKDVKKFECTECPEPVWFPTKSKYCYHLGAKHPGVIKFVCEICTQSFKLKANYKNHLKTHNIVVQKKFSCDVCGGTFVNRAGYEAHRKRFPGPHIKQSCSHCGVSFSKEKHMKNHRCKILLLEEAAAARDVNKNLENEKSEKAPEPVQIPKESKVKSEIQQSQSLLSDKKPVKEGTTEGEIEGGNKKEGSEGDSQSGKKVLFHRLLPKKNEKLVYKQFPLQTQNVPQSVVVQEFREIDLEGGAFITAEPDHQIILRDVNGHLVQGNQILQLDINDFQPGEESQVYLADWNVVAPFVIRGKSP